MAVVPGCAAPLCLFHLPVQFKMFVPPGHSVVHLICSMSGASQAGPAPACSIVISTAGKTGGFLLVVSECKGADQDHPKPALCLKEFQPSVLC